MRRTLDGVRAYPLWRMPIHPAVFFGIMGVALLALIWPVMSIRSQTPSVPNVDKNAEARVKKARQLRLQANDLLHEGNVAAAYAKFAELNKIAPHSDYVNGVMQRLSMIRQQEDVSRQQVVQAKQLFDQGLALFNQKKFAQSIELFQQSFHLNPNADDTAKYLKLAQQEDDKQREAKLAAAKPKPTVVAGKPSVPPGPPTATGTHPAQPTATAGQQGSAPAVFSTYFDSPFNDGYIMVKVGADVVAHENLFEERRLFRRHVARTISVSSAIPAKNADVEIWVVVPSLQINEHTKLRGNFQPGSAHRLTVTADAKTKQFNYQLN